MLTILLPLYNVDKLDISTSAYVFKFTPCIVLPSGLRCCKSTARGLVFASKFTKVCRLACISPLNILLTGSLYTALQIALGL